MEIRELKAYELDATHVDALCYSPVIMRQLSDSLRRSNGKYTELARSICGALGLAGSDIDSVFEFDSVRPILTVGNLDSLGFGIHDKFKINDFIYTVIGEDSILCDDIVANPLLARRDFKIIDKWAKEQGFNIDRLYSREEKQEICSRYFNNTELFDDYHLILAYRVANTYEQFGQNPVYKNAMNMIASDSDFDLKAVNQEFKAAKEWYGRYKNVRLPRREKSAVREDAGNIVAVEMDVQKGLGD